MDHRHRRFVIGPFGALLGSAALLLCAAPDARADVYNLKVVTDVSPDYSDMDSLVHSITSNWETDKDKMWALSYWGHIARQPTRAAGFRIHLHGYKAQDAVKGAVKDEVEVLTSNDGKEFTPAGMFDFRLRWKDIPVNCMWTDEETFAAHNHLLKLDRPVEARYVKFAIKPSRMVVVTEVQVLDGVKEKPYDLRIALPTHAASATSADGR